MLDLVHEFGGVKKDTVFAMFGRAYPPKQLPTATTSNHLAKYLQENFVPVFISQINTLNPGRREGVPDALRRSFLKLNQEFYDKLMSFTRKMSETSTGTNPVITDPSIVRSGASGIVVYIWDKTMYVANVGNALAVVSKGGSAVLMSRKHDPCDRAEIARIRAAEGWISPPGLVSDEIDISRSFGFYYLMPIVNARPDIFTYDLTELDECVIIANRGLWDYVSYQTAVDIAQQTEPMVAAQKLRDFAISCGAEGSIMIMVIGVADLFKGVNILAPLHITPDECPFAVMAHLGNPDHQKYPALENFECEEFWASSNLENWLLTRSRDLCHAIWHISSDMTILERVQSMYLIPTGSPEVSMFIVSSICTALLSL
jgi:adenylate cyclase